MGEDRSTSRTTSRFSLSARPPVRTLAVASIAAAAGAILLVLCRAARLNLPFFVLACALLVFGIALTSVVFLLAARLRTVVLLDADGITVVRGKRRRRVQWSQVGEVTLQGARLTLAVKGDARNVSLINPRRAADPVFQALITSIRQRLDDSRGYRAVA